MAKRLPAKRKAPVKPKAPASGDSWRMSDLPVSDQVELRDRLAQADRGEGLYEFDEAMAIAKRLTDRILKIASEASEDPLRP